MKRITLMVITLTFFPAATLFAQFSTRDDQAVRLDAALRKAGVPSFLVTVKGAGHGKFGTAADGRVTAFFDEYLGGKNVTIPTATIDKWES
jgi:hypothetical protein